jgi:hypothetical protein
VLLAARRGVLIFPPRWLSVTQTVSPSFYPAVLGISALYPAVLGTNSLPTIT